MSSAWLPTLVSGFITLLGVAAIWGALGERVKDHGRRLDALDGPGGAEERQWRAITENTQKVANIRGRLGLNGE